MIYISVSIPTPASAEVLPRGGACSGALYSFLRHQCHLGAPTPCRSPPTVPASGPEAWGQGLALDLSAGWLLGWAGVGH